ncbi:MAG: M15 family metallopeptidase [Clostridia bacterium]|nr:M15 family metallopeptidase [Clostridia bacterium]
MVNMRSRTKRIRIIIASLLLLAVLCGCILRSGEEPQACPSASLEAQSTVRPTSTAQQAVFEELDPYLNDIVPMEYTALKDGSFAYTDLNGRINYRKYGRLISSDGVKQGFFTMDGEQISQEDFGKAEFKPAKTVPSGYQRISTCLFYFSLCGVRVYRAYASIGEAEGFYPCDKNGRVADGALIADIQADELLMDAAKYGVSVAESPYKMASISTVCLVNMNNRLDVKYVPEGLILVAEHKKNARFYLRNTVTYAHPMAFEWFLSMVDAAYEEAGIESFYLCNVYRSYDEQVHNWEENIQRDNKYGTDPTNPVGCAYPGASEHQTGLAFDITCLSHDVPNKYFESTREAVWLKENSWRFGFVLRYPKDKQEITGIKYEPYHFRYVGKELAEYLYKENMCLEEYYDAPVVWVDETATEPKEEQR